MSQITGLCQDQRLFDYKSELSLTNAKFGKL
jgi:hypothetical protein